MQLWQQWVCLGQVNLIESILLQAGFELRVFPLLGLVVAKAREPILRCCLTLSWGEKRMVHSFAENISAKVNVAKFILNSLVSPSAPMPVALPAHQS